LESGALDQPEEDQGEERGDGDRRLGDRRADANHVVGSGRGPRLEGDPGRVDHRCDRVGQRHRAEERGLVPEPVEDRRQ
jgi:hypothetical protein